MSSRSHDVEDFIDKKYKHGFVTDIEADTVPPGSRRGRHPPDLGDKKGEPQFMLDWRLQAYRHWLTMNEPGWAHVHYPTGRLPGHLILLGAEVRRGRAEESRRGRSEAAGNLRQAGHSVARARHRLAGVAVDAVFDSVSVATTFKEKLAEAGVIFCSFSEAVRESSRTGRAVSRHGRASYGQFLRVAEFGRLY